MKHSSNYLFIFLLLLPLLHACNDDAFVDKVRLPLTEATLNGDGDTLTLRFNTSEWQLQHAYRGEMNEITTTYLTGQFYTQDGIDMGRTHCCLDIKGKIIVDCPPYELTFIRPNDRELQICMGDNPTKEPFSFNLAVGDKNYFQQEEIRLTQQPGSGYVIDRIEYDPVPKNVETKFLEDTYLLAGNWTDEPEERTYNLNEKLKRWFSLSCNDDLHLVQTGDEPPTIVVPSADISQGVKPGTDHIKYFRYGSTMLFMDIEPPLLHTLTLEPGYTSIIRIAQYQSYSARYTLHLHNVKTGKTRTIQGNIESTTPTEALTAYPEHHENNENANTIK